MAKLRTKIVIVDNLWSVVVTDNKETRCFYQSTTGQLDAKEVDKDLRFNINLNKTSNIKIFSDSPVVYERLSKRKKLVLTLNQNVK